MVLNMKFQITDFQEMILEDDLWLLLVLSFGTFSQRPLFFAKVSILSKEFKGAPLRVGGGSFKMARRTRNKGLFSELVVFHLKICWVYVISLPT